MPLLSRFGLVATLLLLSMGVAMAKTNNTPSSEKVVTHSTKDAYKVHKHEKKKHRKEKRRDTVTDHHHHT